MEISCAFWPKNGELKTFYWNHNTLLCVTNCHEQKIHPKSEVLDIGHIVLNFSYSRPQSVVKLHFVIWNLKYQGLSLWFKEMKQGRGGRRGLSLMFPELN